MQALSDLDLSISDSCINPVSDEVSVLHAVADSLDVPEAW